MLQRQHIKIVAARSKIAHVRADISVGREPSERPIESSSFSFFSKCSLCSLAPIESFDLGLAAP